MRSANGLLKAAGMCCEMTIAGRPAASSRAARESLRCRRSMHRPRRCDPSCAASACRFNAGNTADVLWRSSTSARALRRVRYNSRSRRRLHFRDELILVVLERPGDVDAGLRNEIDRTELQRAQRDVGAALGQRRHHHDRHRPQPHQVLQEREAVHARHLDVERDHVRIELLDLLARRERVAGSADDFDVRRARQDGGQELAHQRRVVDHEHFDGHATCLQKRSISPATGVFSRRSR